MNVIMEICHKILTPHAAFKVTRIDRLHMTLVKRWAQLIGVHAGRQRTYSVVNAFLGGVCLFVCLFAWGLTALSAQIGYIAP